MKRSLILHPFLFSSFVVISAYAANLSGARPGDAARPLAALLAAAGLLTGLFRLVSRGWRRAALAASLVLALFFTYGHAYAALRRVLPPGALLAQADVLMAAWAAALIVGVWLVLRKLRGLRRATLLANAVSGAALAAALLTLAGGWLRSQPAGELGFKHPQDLEVQPGPGWTGEKPDVYYIILDGYGSQETLRDFYGVDNSAFLEGLRRRGFTVAAHSRTNYWKTALSLGSSLNFHYMDELLELQPESLDPRPLDELIQHSAARRFFERLGYRTAAFSTGYAFSELRDADLYYPSLQPLSPFELNLLQGSMAVVWVDWAAPVYHRQDVLRSFARLGELAEVEGPKFVFAHLVIPHPPFVFDEQGRPAAPLGSADGIEYSGGREHYLKGYAGQVRYANRLVEETIDAILARSATPPVIVLQGDHGPGAYLDWTSVENSCLSERFPILNAYYFPGKEAAARTIPQDASPVNSLRMLLNAYFDAGLHLQPNRHYAVHWKESYRLYEVTGRLDECPAAAEAQVK